MSTLPASSHQEVVDRLKASIQGGKHWYLALIEAVRDYPEGGFLIGSDALDWMSLAQLLATEAGSLIDGHEFSRFIDYGKPPIKITADEARQLVGISKYNLYLNYLYGVTIEAALVKAVTAEVQKEYYSLGLPQPADAPGRAFVRIYGAEVQKLRDVFSAGAAAVKAGRKDVEFTYWLFKYRLKNSDKEKVASDTKKALNWLNSQGNFFPRLF